MALSKEEIQAAIAKSKQIIEQRKAEKAAQQKALEADAEAAISMNRAKPLPSSVAEIASHAGVQWNEEQKMAIDYGYYGKTFSIIGSAGTGKTTVLRGLLSVLIEQHRLPMLEQNTRYLTANTPGVALISYTRRAVRNIAKQMPESLKSHCITFHKLVEYQPEKYWDKDEDGELVEKTRFAPARNRMNPLPRNLKTIVVDEASMLSIDYFNQLLDALPDPSQVQFIFLGDLNQLPPVYGQAILGKALLNYPIVELTRVYRQALESPIISLALAVKNNDFSVFATDCNSGTFHVNGEQLDIRDVVKRPKLENLSAKTIIERPGRGKVTLHPWKKTLDKEDALFMMQQQIRLWIKNGEYLPDEDLILCPWNTSFGTDELNKSIANDLAKMNNKVVWEVIAGYNKHYFAVGDKLLVDKMEAVILDINRNPKYLGKQPQKESTKLDRWGMGGAGVSFSDDNITDEQIDFMLEHAAMIEDRTAQASHAIKVRFLDTDEEETITQSAVINAATFAYAITVHKAQGSECRKVFFLTHACHAAMCSRELVYTGITRAAEELYIVMTPQMLARAAKKPRIKGDTLAAKLEYFNSRLSEKEGGTQMQIEGEE